MTQPDYILSISKEELAEMPVTSFDGQIILIDNAAGAHEALRRLSDEKIVGFDTETKPSFRKGIRNKVALMQISTAGCCYLFRLNKIGICAELKAFLENPDILKIGLSVHDDFGAIRRSEEFEPQGFVDLQQMVRDFEIADISLQKIYAIIFGCRISKGQRLTNWEAETLTEAQQAYAALDAWACLRIYNVLADHTFDNLHSPYRHHPEPDTTIAVVQPLEKTEQKTKRPRRPRTKAQVKAQGDAAAASEALKAPKKRHWHRRRKTTPGKPDSKTNEEI